MKREQKRSPGRPTVPPEKRIVSRTVSIRFSDEQLQTIKSALKITGEKMNPFVRKAIQIRLQNLPKKLKFNISK